MKLSHLTVIFVIIILPIVLLLSAYISNGFKTIQYQSLYDTGLLTATHDALYAFEINSRNNIYSDIPDTKRNILKSSVKAFEKSLCNTCGISSYNTDEVEEYIPALLFGMYDGFYMYAPTYNSKTGKYEHNLKNYVYYSETIDDNITIIYSLDNYVTVAGDFGIKEGHLIPLDKLSITDSEIKYNYLPINMDDEDAVNYYKDGQVFTKWFNENIGKKIVDSNNKKYLYINSNNDPEDENSLFVQNKRKIIKNKIESVLNSSIVAYSERTWGRTYKMPKLSAEDWDKIYSNVSMISFFQGKQVGFNKYNGYCVLNSTNNNEYVNPNLIYFVQGDTYHDIRCTQLTDAYSAGYKIERFLKKKEEIVNSTTGEITENYSYERDEKACYSCINGQIDFSSKGGYKSVYESVQNIPGASAGYHLRRSYWTALARERYKQIKILKENNLNLIKTANKITSEDYGKTVTNYIPKVKDGINYDDADVKWKIFYTDTEHIYLIADNYISPKFINGATTTDRFYYVPLKIEGYNGSSDIKDERIKKLNNAYFTRGYSSTSNNMKAVAYMLDTDKWDGFKNDKYAEYAIAGPTIELFISSYNQKYNTNYQASISNNSVGYRFDSSPTFNKQDTLYVPDTERAWATWIASPCYYNSDSVLYVGNRGNVGADPYTNPSTSGFRPVICLKSDVKLKKVSDNEYKIVEEDDVRTITKNIVVSWNDDDNIYGKRPNSIQIAGVTLSASNGYTGILEYEENEEENIDFSAPDVNHYSKPSDYYIDADDNLVYTYTLTGVKTKNIVVSWNDDDNLYDTRPSSIKVAGITLYKSNGYSGKINYIDEPSISASKITHYNSPQISNSGNEIRCTYNLKAVSGYKKSNSTIYKETSDGWIFIMNMGDTINYDSLTGATTKSYTTTSYITESNTKPTFYLKNINSGWRVIGLNSNGQIEIISNESVADLTLEGYRGYRYGISTINGICKLYDQGKGAVRESARSVKSSDLTLDLGNLTNTWLPEQYDKVQGTVTWYGLKKVSNYLNNVGNETLVTDYTSTDRFTNFSKTNGVRPIITLEATVKLESTTKLNTYNIK